MPRPKFQPGNPGRPKGTPNHLTRTVKETVLAVFNKLQDDPKNNLEEFAKKYPRDFHAIAAKLIPTDIKGEVKQVSEIQLKIVRGSRNGANTAGTASGPDSGDQPGEEV